MNFLIEKQPIICGTLVITIENQALPSLHCALETAFTKSTSVLLISGAVCSAVHKRNNSYIFFDSHSHGEDCLSSSDGTSILMSFSCLEDLIAYLYAFYESLRIDLTMQFDLLPISVRKKYIPVLLRNRQRTCLKPTFMIKLCVKNRRLSLQKNQNQA